ncbi:MAG TPA: NAD(P)-dependent oxidoreductase [Candidatus Avacidaminococcus intestinavium]|uniref:NAD(P)-dependent oxidoreductase n=1 Tax=Candidatus Avacidaminococcus intestinavium TaxID=2840684 RepID=A0A9D1SL79_9FIRM|nr:NAD(P)-dependent oxidoreductase [Candidatus Avacidaminococcus intestinavium]
MSKILTMHEAIAEAKRCLHCSRPLCRTGCPIENNIPAFIRALSEGNIGAAYEIIAERSNLPAICGRVCAHERQCEAHCILAKKNAAIAIGSLEMFIADFAHEYGVTLLPPSTGKRGKVAIIGSGPAGLTVAGDLAKMDFDVTIFESQPEPGGVLLFGIPEFRLEKNVVRREISILKDLGVKIITDVLVGPDLNVDDLFAKDFDAIFMGTGTALPNILNIPGQHYAGIVTSTYFLRVIVLSDSGKLDKKETLLDAEANVIVIGAGNVAVDAARTAIRRTTGSVTVVYHKTAAEMSCLHSEYEAALAEGVQFEFLKKPVAYLDEQQLHDYATPATASAAPVAGILFETIAKDADGNFTSTNQQQALPCDFVILAVGQKPASRIVSTTKGIQVDDRGFVITKERPYGMTTRAGVFSSGDVVHGPKTVVLAMKESKKVAAGIAQYIDAKKLLADCQ